MDDLDVDDRWNALTWSFGTVVWLTDALSFAANAATGFRAPTYSDTLSRGPFTFGVNAPSTRVDPETSFSYELDPRGIERRPIAPMPPRCRETRPSSGGQGQRRTRRRFLQCRLRSPLGAHAMRITCPGCGAAGRLKQAPTALVRCPKCKERWDPRVQKDGREDARSKRGARRDEDEEPPRKRRKKRRQEPRRAPEPPPDEARDPESKGGDGPTSTPRKRRRKPAAAPAKGSPERAGGRRRRGRRGRSASASASGEREDRGRRGSRRRRSKATLPLVLCGIALALVGAVGGTVWFLQRRTGGSGATLRDRAEGYVRALRAADADAMLRYLHPGDIERIRQKQGQTGVDLLKNLLSLGATMLKSAQQAGAKVSITVSKAEATGDRGTVELVTRVEHEGKTQSRTSSMGWVRRDGSWYLASPSAGAAAGGRTGAAGASRPPVDETAPDETAPDADPEAGVDITAPDETAPDGTAPDDETDPDADVDITAPD